MKKANLFKLFLAGMSVLLLITGCSGGKEVSEDKVAEYKETLNKYYLAYGEGDFEEAVSYFNKGFEYEEAGQKYIGEDVIKAAIIKNQHLKHEFEIVSMESTEGGILVTLKNSSYLLKLSGLEAYESQEFFTFKNDKINSVVTKINEDDYIYISKMIEADPGIILEKQQDKTIVSGFAENSSAEAAGILIGSELLAIDGAIVKDFELGTNEAVYRLAGRNETIVKVKILQEGKETEFELERKQK